MLFSIRYLSLGLGVTLGACVMLGVSWIPNFKPNWNFVGVPEIASTPHSTTDYYGQGAKSDSQSAATSTVRNLERERVSLAVVSPVEPAPASVRTGTSKDALDQGGMHATDSMPQRARVSLAVALPVEPALASLPKSRTSEEVSQNGMVVSPVVTAREVMLDTDQDPQAMSRERIQPIGREVEEARVWAMESEKTLDIAESKLAHTVRMLCEIRELLSADSQAIDSHGSHMLRATLEEIAAMLIERYQAEKRQLLAARQWVHASREMLYQVTEHATLAWQSTEAGLERQIEQIVDEQAELLHSPDGHGELP